MVVDFYVFGDIIVMVGVVGEVVWIEVLVILFGFIFCDLFCEDFVGVICLGNVEGEDVGFKGIFYIWYWID